MSTKYLFLGGPWDKQTHKTDGSPTYYVADYKPLGLATEVSLDPTYSGLSDITHVYYLKKLNIFEKMRSVYVHTSYPDIDATRAVGELMAALFDIFVEA